MADTVRVIQAFQRRVDNLQLTIDSIQARIAETPLVFAPDGTDNTDAWLDREVASLVRLYSEKAMTDAASALWINKRL